MVQVSAEVAEGIADAALVVGGERRLRLCHGRILLGSLACHQVSLKEIAPLSLALD